MLLSEPDLTLRVCDREHVLWDLAVDHRNLQPLGVMNDAATIQRCLAYVETQLGPQRSPRRPGVPLCVTLSRQSGAGGTAIAHLLASYLDAHGKHAGPRWTIFDKALVERVLREHNLPAKFAHYMPEDRVSYIRDAVEELVGLHPSSTELVSQVSQTIFGLAEMGNCILIGRASHIILARSPGVFHVRIVAPFQKRIERIMRDEDLPQSSAMEFAQHEDAARSRYVKTHFDADVTDPLSYDLVVNTGSFTDEQAARLIGEAAILHAEMLEAAGMSASTASARPTLASASPP